MTEPFEQVHDDRGRRVELLISYILRGGVIASLLIIVLGTAVSFIHHPDYMRDPAELKRLTRSDAAFPHSVHDVIQGVRELRGQAIVLVGILLLISTPVLRVAASIFGFFYQHDRLYVVITSIVLLLLLLSFVLGRVEG